MDILFVIIFIVLFLLGIAILIPPFQNILKGLVFFIVGLLGFIWLIIVLSAPLNIKSVKYLDITYGAKTQFAINSDGETLNLNKILGIIIPPNSEIKETRHSFWKYGINTSCTRGDEKYTYEVVEKNNTK